MYTVALGSASLQLKANVCPGHTRRWFQMGFSRGLHTTISQSVTVGIPICQSEASVDLTAALTEATTSANPTPTRQASLVREGQPQWFGLVVKLITEGEMEGKRTSVHRADMLWIPVLAVVQKGLFLYTMPPPMRHPSRRKLFDVMVLGERLNACPANLETMPPTLRPEDGNRPSMEVQCLTDALTQNDVPPSFDQLWDTISTIGPLPSGLTVPLDIYYALAQCSGRFADRRETDPGLHLRERWDHRCQHFCEVTPPGKVPKQYPPLFWTKDLKDATDVHWKGFRQRVMPRLEQVARLALTSIGVDFEWLLSSCRHLLGPTTPSSSTCPSIDPDILRCISRAMLPCHSLLCRYKCCVGDGASMNSTRSHAPTTPYSSAPLIGLMEVLTRVSTFLVHTTVYSEDAYHDRNDRVHACNDYGSLLEGGANAGLRGTDDCEGRTREVARQWGEYTDAFLLGACASAPQYVGYTETSAHFAGEWEDVFHACWEEFPLTILIGRLCLEFLPLAVDTCLLPTEFNDNGEDTACPTLPRVISEWRAGRAQGNMGSLPPQTRNAMWSVCAATGGGAGRPLAPTTSTNSSPGGHIMMMLLPRTEAVALLSPADASAPPPCFLPYGVCHKGTKGQARRAVPPFPVECTQSLWYSALAIQPIYVNHRVEYYEERVHGTTRLPKLDATLCDVLGLDAKTTEALSVGTTGVYGVIDYMRYLGVELMTSGEMALRGCGIIQPHWKQILYTKCNESKVRLAWNVPLGSAVRLAGVHMAKDLPPVKSASKESPDDVTIAAYKWQWVNKPTINLPWKEEGGRTCFQLFQGKCMDTGRTRSSGLATTRNIFLSDEPMISRVTQSSRLEKALLEWDQCLIAELSRPEWTPSNDCAPPTGLVGWGLWRTVQEWAYLHGWRHQSFRWTLDQQAAPQKVLETLASEGVFTLMLGAEALERACLPSSFKRKTGDSPWDTKVDTNNEHDLQRHPYYSWHVDPQNPNPDRTWEKGLAVLELEVPVCEQGKITQITVFRPLQHNRSKVETQPYPQRASRGDL